MTSFSIPAHWQQFPAGCFGLFIYRGSYTQYVRGEQVLVSRGLHARPGRTKAGWI